MTVGVHVHLQRSMTDEHSFRLHSPCRTSATPQEWLRLRISAPWLNDRLGSISDMGIYRIFFPAR
jgi:hypothetical protein